MELIYKGKTKDVYRLEDGNIKLKFKDDVTGADGKFDPGANEVGLSIKGVGLSGLKMTTYFFKKLHEKNIPTHFIKEKLDEVSLVVKDAVMFGAGLEVICRYRAVGSFYRRYGAYCEEGKKLDGFIEITLKDDERNDPPISRDALTMLNILTEEEYKTLKILTREISDIIKDELLQKGLELYDIKLEFARNRETNEIMLIDEISGGNMRVYNKMGDFVPPIDLEKYFLGK